MRVKMFGASLLLLCALITPSFAGDIFTGKPDGDIFTGKSDTNPPVGTIGIAGVLLSDAPIIINDLIGRLPRG